MPEKGNIAARRAWLAPLEASEVYLIHDGKIVTYAWTVMAESLARLKPVLAEVMPSEPPAAPSSENPVSEMKVTIWEGACTYGDSMILQTEEIQVTMDVQDQDKTLAALTFSNLDPDKDFADLVASTPGSGPPAWADMISMKSLSLGESRTYSFTVELDAWSGGVETCVDSRKRI